jgi:hypothetical protein
VTSRLMKRLARNRVARTGEKYTEALRALQAAGPEEIRAARDEDRQIRDRQRYPSTPADGLGRRHVLSAFETSRRRH